MVEGYINMLDNANIIKTVLCLKKSTSNAYAQRKTTFT